MNLYQKIIEVRKVADSFKKDVEKDGLKYKYVSGNQILSKIKDCMNEQQLILQPSIKIGNHEIHNYKTQYGKDKIDFIVSGEMSYTWINAEEPKERECVEWAYYGQQDEISKALGSGLTYSERYFLLKYFGLPTDEDDPDGKLPEKEKQSQSKAQQNKQIATNEQGNTNITEKQAKRLLAIAASKGIEKVKVQMEAHSKYKVNSFLELTKTQYDTLCKSYESLPSKIEQETGNMFGGQHGNP